MKDVKIKDAPLLEQVSGSEKIPVSDGSGNPKTVSVDQIKAGLATEESVGNAIEHTTNSIAAHNTSSEAHADIREGITSAVSAHNADEAAHPSILQKIQEARSIAEGRALSLVFATVEALDAWLAVADNVATLKVGDNLFIKDVGVPDYWWDGTKKQKLETQKVDLTAYALTADVNAALAERDARLDALEEKEGQHAANVEALIAAKETLGNVSMVSCDIQDMPTINGKPMHQIAAGAPTMAPDFPGQLYFDTTNKKLYGAFGVDSTSNWTVMN